MYFFYFWSENPPKFAKIVKNMTLLLLCPYSLKNVEIIQIMQFLKFLVRKSPKICKHFEKYVIVVKNVLVVIFLPKKIALKPPENLALKPPENLALKPPEKLALKPPEKLALKPPEKLARANFSGGLRAKFSGGLRAIRDLFRALGAIRWP